MKIAFISYEFPPETGFGGIGTYTYQISKALADRGHIVEVFSCSREEDKLNISVDGVVNVHRVKANKRSVFAERIVEVFALRHTIVNFDIIESPEYCAEGLMVRKAFPNVPMVVKLHTPLYMVNRMNNTYKPVSFKKKIKQLIGRNNYNKHGDPDYQLTASADAVCSPSQSLADIIKREWVINNIDVIPYVFKPLQDYYSIPLEQHSKNIVAFTGRLEVRKGIVSFIKAIPLILKTKPGTIFRFIGSSGDAPSGSGTMESYIKEKLKDFANNLEFTGFVQRESMPSVISDVSVFVFPSIWENFPFVCLEAMSAGKPVIASDAGGMKEMLEGDKGGKIVRTKDKHQISKAVIEILNHKQEALKIGEHNRKRIQEYYASEVLNISESYYQKVIRTKHTVITN